MKEAKITCPIKARAAVADCLSMGVQIQKFLKDMNNQDWLDLANGLVKHFLNEAAKDKIHYLIPRKRK